jgi:DNA primase
MYDLEDIIVDLLGTGRGGVNKSYHCPFHRDRNASFSINMNEGLWICFSCNERGNYEKLCRLLDAIPDYDYKVRKALNDASREPEEVRDFTSLSRRLHADMGDDGQMAIRAFLDSRGIRPYGSTVSTFTLGWNRERRAIAFPYPDSEGVVRGIKYRYRDGFKASEDGSNFNVYHPELAIGRDTVFIFEGESDTLRGWSELGEDYGVCGTSGASVSESQWQRFALNFLFTRRIYLAYDADQPGDDCAELAMRVLGDKCRRLRPTRGNDVSEHLMAGGTLKEIGIE